MKRDPLTNGSRPVHDFQTVERTEVLRILGYERECSGNRDCGNLSVDERCGPTLVFEARTLSTVPVGGSLIVRQDRE
jgi:hypothetical protein